MGGKEQKLGQPLLGDPWLAEIAMGVGIGDGKASGLPDIPAGADVPERVRIVEELGRDGNQPGGAYGKSECSVDAADAQIMRRDGGAR